jgi:hypothetical protein
MNKRLYLILLFAILAVFGNEALALGSGMGMGPPNPPCGQGPFPPCPIPLDGGLLLLTGAGVILGGKSLMKTLKKNPD